MDEDLKYSVQALVLIKSLSGFDKQEFEKWFWEHLSIGSNTILQYLMEKEAERQKLIKLS